MEVPSVSNEINQLEVAELNISASEHETKANLEEKELKGNGDSFNNKPLFENFKEYASFDHPSTNRQYFIGCKWSPDGSCLLTNCADFKLRIIDLPNECHSKKFSVGSDHSVRQLKPSLVVTEVGLVFDYAWYPAMSSWNPPTCCFISSCSSSPVHLWDAYTGKIRASYKPYDYADEVQPALSVNFSTTGEDIYCGFKNYVKIFDISKPGRSCDIFNLKQISGQRGIISCITENPVMTDLFAAGSYHKTIGLYTRSKQFVCLLTGQKNGLTHLKFSADGKRLISGSRMDNEIIVWDIRNPGIVLFSMKRVVETNQRIYFDLTKDNKYLISGGTDGFIRVWDLEDLSRVNKGELDSMLTVKIQNDCINGVSAHSTYPLVATASGQQHRLDITDDDEDALFYDKTSEKAENNVKLWWIGSTDDELIT